MVEYHCNKLWNECYPIAQNGLQLNKLFTNLRKLYQSYVIKKHLATTGSIYEITMKIIKIYEEKML